MARPLGKYLIAIDEGSYKVDLEVIDRYQSFSSELLRLSLLGITGYGFLLSQIVFKNTGSTQFFNSLQERKYVLIVGICALGLSTAFALLHRYSSTEGIIHFVRLLRLQKEYEELSDEELDTENLEKMKLSKECDINRETGRLHKDMKRCKWFLAASATLLFIGAISVAITFMVTLF